MPYTLSADLPMFVGQLLFSETKDPEDAIAIAHVIKNRMSRPNRFGQTYQDVILAPNQFSGVGSDEWNKIEKGNLTQEELELFQKFQRIATEVFSGEIEDPTSGADHYYNPEISDPDWGKIYKETYKNKFHRYLQEAPSGEMVGGY